MDQTLPLGQYTSTIYGAIKEQRYNDAIGILLIEYQNFPRSRAALSLLAYCHYHVNDFASAAQYYELLLGICPDVDEYRIYYAQSLYKAGMYAEATRSAVRVDNEQYSQRIRMLQAVIKYEQDELPSSKSLLDQCHADDPDVIVNYAAVSFKEGNFEAARTQYTEAINTMGYQPDLALNIALCYYREVLGKTESYVCVIFVWNLIYVLCVLPRPHSAYFCISRNNTDPHFATLQKSLKKE
jgi:tetratricopeptide repeat protein 30